MIPTSTDVSIDISPKPPASARAIAILVHKETTFGQLGLSMLDEPARTAVEQLFDARAFRGKSNEVTVHWYNAGRAGMRRMLIIGMGNPKTFSLLCLREAGVALARAMRRLDIESAALVLPKIPDRMPGLPNAKPQPGGRAAGAEAVASGIVLGSFEFREFKGAAQPKDASTRRKPKKVTIVAADARGLAPAVRAGEAIGLAQNFARTIASRPGNQINPVSLAAVAQAMCRESGLTCRVLDERQMQKMGMGGMLAVGSGSTETPPRMIAIEYRGGARKGGTRGRPLLVVGKAITFDTGGISIKPAEKMGRMIYDKSGGMAVLGLMLALAKLKLPVTVIGILAAAENHISGKAYRPGDILKMYNGVTVEVTNTDAEGRLVLGDALAWGVETYGPAAAVDLATLTGGVVTALGRSMAGLMSTSDALADELTFAGQRAGEKMWRLPLGEEQREQIKSEHADIINAAGREAHPLQGGAFLSHFVPEGDKLPWAHLDIAGVADTEKETALYGKGSTGWGVRTLVEWVRGRMG